MVMPLHLLTADNISDDDSEEYLLYHIVADIEDQFRELWRVGN
jgi:hypothetical protein